MADQDPSKVHPLEGTPEAQDGPDEEIRLTHSGPLNHEIQESSSVEEGRTAHPCQSRHGGGGRRGEGAKGRNPEGP